MGETAVFVRKARFSAVVQEVPGEWDFEVAVRGQPDPMSGMIINLVDLDRIISDFLRSQRDPSSQAAMGNLTIPEADLFFKGAAGAIGLEINKLTLKSELESLALDDGEYRHTFLLRDQTAV